jgi:hypothetical protein
MFIIRYCCYMVLLFVGIKGFSQQVIFREDFEKPDFGTAARQPHLFILDPYSPREKLPYNLFADRKESSYTDWYTDNRCHDSAVKQGFYTSIALYSHDVPFTREILAIRLDSGLSGGKTYRVSVEALFHKYTEYRVDSIQILFLKTEKDIKNWLAGKDFLGEMIGLGLERVDNQHWKNVAGDFTPESDYAFMLIGNLKRDDECKIIKVNDCKCPKERHRNWNYSELLLDNIVITAF